MRVNLGRAFDGAGSLLGELQVIHLRWVYFWVWKVSWLVVVVFGICVGLVADLDPGVHSLVENRIEKSELLSYLLGVGQKLFLEHFD